MAKYLPKYLISQDQRPAVPALRVASPFDQQVSLVILFSTWPLVLQVLNVSPLLAGLLCSSVG